MKTVPGSMGEHVTRQYARQLRSSTAPLIHRLPSEIPHRCVRGTIALQQNHMAHACR
jgi:hypothetical protein